MFMRRMVAPVAAIGVAALLLSGCSSSGDADSVENAETPTGSEAPLYAELPEWVKEKGSLTFAGDSHPPYRTVNTDGSVTGIDPDFLELISAQLGVEIDIEITSGLDSILMGMLSERYDGFNGPVRSTAEREAEFDSIVWMTTRTAYVFLETREDVEDSADVCGLTVAGVEGSVTERQVEALNEWCVAEGLSGNEFVGLADTNATVLAVQSGRADVLAITETGAIDLLFQTPDTFGYVTQTDEQGAGVDFLAMLTPKANDLGPVLYKAVQNLFENGEYQTFMAENNLSNVALDEPLFNPMTS